MRTDAVEHLARQLSRMERSGRGGRRHAARLTSGITPLDELLPDGGFCPGTLVEWLAPAEGSGAGTLLFQVAASVLRQPGQLIVVDPSGEFYPPAAACLGIDLRRLLVVRPRSERDTFWTWEQALRCPGVVATAGRLGPINDRVFRRLQLAAERGGGLGLLWRAALFRGQPSWADIRLHVRPLEVKPLPGLAVEGLGRRLQLELLRCRGNGRGRRIELELNDETGAVRLATGLAVAKVVRRATGA